VGALVAPVAIIAAALAVGIGGGGLTGIRSIGQALSGPQLPQIAPAASDERGPADEAGRLLARVGPTAARQRAERAAAAPDTTPGGGGGTRLPASTPGPTAGTRPPQPASPAPAPAATAAPSATPAPAQTPSPVRQVGNGVKSITNQVPVARQPVGQVVDLLVDTIDGLPPGPIIP
jgi:hypothetical protein